MTVETVATKAAAGRQLAYAALAAVCVLWGTTYLGIRIALESLPPLYLIAIRYTISGSVLVAFAASGSRLPPRRELLQTCICGIICIGIGNGFLAIAEVWVPSGLAALIYTTCPFWMVAIDAVFPAGHRPSRATLFGLLVGVAGVACLIFPAARNEGWRSGTFLGFLVLQLSAAGWVTGALLQKRVATTTLPVVTGGIQQLAAGLAMFVPALLFEHAPHHVSTRSELAIGYLVLFGSFIGFTSFVYSMQRLPVALVSVYTFVNPVVAVALGWLFFREPFGYRELVAMLIIFSGVGLVKRSEAATVSSP